MKESKSLLRKIYVPSSKEDESLLDAMLAYWVLGNLEYDRRSFRLLVSGALKNGVKALSQRGIEMNDATLKGLLAFREEFSSVKIGKSLPFSSFAFNLSGVDAVEGYFTYEAKKMYQVIRRVGKKKGFGEIISNKERENFIISYRLMRPHVCKDIAFLLKKVPFEEIEKEIGLNLSKLRPNPFNKKVTKL